MKKKMFLSLLIIIATVILQCSVITATEQVEVEGNINFQLENRTLEFKQYAIGTDYEGKLALILVFDYCNKSENASAAAYDFYIQVFQKGIERDFATLSFDGEWSEERGNYSKEVKDGATLTICTGFLLEDAVSPVDVEVQELVNWDETQGMTIDISQFSGETSAATEESESSADWETMYNELLADYEDLQEEYNILLAELEKYENGNAENEIGTTPVQETEAPLPEAQVEVANTSSMTKGQENALKAAQQYLSIMSFSHDGLVEQLEYEGYSNEDAVFAVDNCGADWNEQAAKSAEQYLSIMSFSRSGLIEQLEYDGYTNSQAVYGAEANGY